MNQGLAGLVERGRSRIDAVGRAGITAGAATSLRRYQALREPIAVPEVVSGACTDALHTAGERQLID